MKQYNYVKGRIIECKALEFVTKVKKLKVLETNYSTKIGEIDIIAKAKDKTIIFVVDELDRCLPEYSIKVLERLHHVFEKTSNIQVI